MSKVNPDSAGSSLHIYIANIKSIHFLLSS